MWNWAPGDASSGQEDEEQKEGVEDEDEGVEDVRRAVKEKRRGEQDVNPTGGRLVGGSSEEAMKQSKGEDGGDEVMLCGVLCSGANRTVVWYSLFR